MTGGAYVSLGMYPFEPIRPAWEALVVGLHERLDWIPELDWDVDVHDAWLDSRCVVSQTCGWPLVTRLAERVRVVGAFSLTLPDARGHVYRSVLLAARPGRAAEFARPGVRAAVNSFESLSGWISLLTGTGTGGTGGRWPGEVVLTGGHAESIRAVADGRAEIASIDAITLAHVRRLDPNLTDGLHEVGHGPWVPSLPIIVPGGTSDAHLAELRAAFAGVLADRRFRSRREALMFDGFVPLDLADYDEVRRLGASS